MRPFDLDGGTRVLFGAGRLAELGAETARLTAGPVLLVSDPGVAAAGHTGRAADSLAAAGLEVVRFDGVGENPTTAQVQAGAETARRHGPVGAVVSVGGGSAMDCAKGINFFLSHGGPMEDWEGDGDRGPMLPSIGVPTTAGTGSEAQRFALISRESDHRKMACGDPGARFRTVILDPELPLSAPFRAAAAAAIDAVAHAVESFTATNANPASRLYARQAARLLFGAFEGWVADPSAGAGAGEMLLGAHWAGASIERSMLGAAHACANPLTRVHGVTHGVAVGLMLPHVIRFNGAAAEGLYAGLLHASGTGAASKAGADAAEALAARVEELLEAAGLPRRLRDLRVPEDGLEGLAAEAAGQKTARFNPRPVDAAECAGLYGGAY